MDLDQVRQYREESFEVMITSAYNFDCPNAKRHSR